MSGSTLNPFSFSGVQGISPTVSIQGDQRSDFSGQPNFQLLAPNNTPISNPFANSVTGMNSTTNFQMAPPSVSYFGSSGIPQSAISQTVSNPINLVGQSTIYSNPVSTAAVANNITQISHNNISTPLSEIQKLKLNILNQRLRLAENELSNMQKSCYKRNYNSLPKDISKYNSWRQQFLMQAQSDFHMHELYDPMFIPSCEKFPIPQFSDPEWEGRLELAKLKMYRLQ